MRRYDREVTDFEEIVEIISRCDVIRIGFSEDGIPYIVPLNFAYEANDGQITFFFHSAAKGKKIDIIKKNPYVCFELDRFKIISDKIPCKWSAEYESIIGYGKIHFIDHYDEKKSAMDLIMKRYGFEGNCEYSPEVFSRTVLYKLSVNKITGKRNT